MNIYQKLVEVRKAVPYLKKEAKGSQYNYVASSQVLASVREKMDELQLLIIPEVTDKRVTQTQIKTSRGNEVTNYFTELDLNMTIVNGEKPDEQITRKWYGQGVDLAGEKGVGKALTYAEKYFILKLFNIPTDQDDPDRFQAKYYEEEETPEKPKPAPKPAAKPKAAKSKTPTPQTTDEKKAELISRIAILCTQKGRSPEWLQDSMIKVFGKEDLNDLTITELTRIVTGLERD